MRDPVNGLYDSACEILDACRRFSLELSRPQSDEARAATFGCLEEALAELADAHAALYERLRNRPGAEPETTIPLMVALESATLALEDAREACASARRAAGRRFGRGVRAR